MAPPHLHHVTSDQVARLLSACLREGCLAATLNRIAPGKRLIDVLVPANLFPHFSEVDRAVAVEQLLLHACAARDAKRAEAAQILLGLSGGWKDESVTQRRHAVGRLLGGSGDGFRRRHEGDLLHDVAFEAIRFAADMPYSEPQQLHLQLVG